MQTPLERAAMALRDGNNPEGDWEPWIDDARAVLEAIREPSEAMCSVYYDLEPIHAQDSLSANDAWQAMLDTAIKGE